MATSKLRIRLQHVALVLSVISSVITILEFTTGIGQFGTLKAALAGHFRTWLEHLPEFVTWPVWAIGRLLWVCLVAAYRLVMLIGLPAVPAVSVFYLCILYVYLRTGRVPSPSEDGPFFIALFTYIGALAAFVAALNISDGFSLSLGM